MRISYSKGRAIIRCAEKELGQAIVHRTQGGTGGGQAAVTAYGRYLLEVYTKYDTELKNFASERFDELLLTLNPDEVKE